ncbi:MAG: peptidoglycan-binding domain-containing protein [Terriglobales bacterium]|jgi:hypothetical protein
MLRSDQLPRWRRIGLCALLSLAVHGFAVAQTETTTPPKKPAHAAPAPTKKSAHNTTTHATPAHATSAHTSTHKHSAAQKSKTSHGKKGSKLVAKKHGQQAIDSARAREIQEALIRQHYMQGEPSGDWDSATQAAMQRYQADQGWQSKTTPDSRALIKLGLGPSHDHLLNPESAMTTSTPTPVAPDPGAAPKPTPADNNLPQR